MNWSDFYLICFLVGFGLSALALLAGSVHLHLPHLHVHHGIHVARGAGVGRGGRAAVVQFRHHRRVSGLVRRHRLPAGALLPRLVRAGAGRGDAQRARRARRWCSGFWPRC